MRAMARNRPRNLKKRPGENDIPDIGPYLDQHTHSWALLGDKVYQGDFEFVRAMKPRKMPAHGSLTREDEDYRERLTSDGIIVESFFGRLCQLWGVMSQKFKWGEALYDDLVRMFLSLTNGHIHYHPLRSANKKIFNRRRNRQRVVGEDIAKNCRREQHRYREKRRRRIETTLRITYDDSDASL